MHGDVQLSDELRIHYISMGQGQPLIFIPGWTMTTNAFRRNLAPLSARFRAIAYDPRSQGKSSKLECGNHYMQHGQDLAAFIRELDLKNVVLLGWSTGVLTAYSYFEQFGCTSVQAFVSIDMSPRPVKDKESDWGIESRENVRRMQAGVTAPDQSAMIRKVVSSSYLTRPADESFVEESCPIPSTRRRMSPRYCWATATSAIIPMLRKRWRLSCRSCRSSANMHPAPQRAGLKRIRPTPNCARSVNT